MKKYGLRILVGLMAFVIGVCAVIFSFKRLINSVFVEKKSTPVFTSEAECSGKVEIYYKGFYKDENGIINAEFEIINGSSKNIYYRSLTKGVDYQSSVSLNGKEGQRVGYCGFTAMSMKDFAIESSEIIRFKLQSYRFWEFSPKRKRQDFRVGFDLKYEGNENYETIWSNEFQLPEWVQGELKKY